MEIFADMFNYQFMVRAITVGLLVSLCASLLGVSMVLKRYSMIGDGLSHVGFAALAAAAAAGIAPLKVAIPVCIAAAFLMLRISENSKLKGDATVAIVCSGALAIGVMIISMSSGMNTDVNNYMFGSILSLSAEDALVSRILSIIVVLLFVVFYNRIFAVTFDENFARATGTKAGLYNGILAVLTAVTVVIGMRMMGALLISSLIIFPSLSSMRICKRYRMVIISSVIISVVCFMIGITVSFAKSTPAGASVVCANLIVFAICSLIGALKGRVGKKA
ncbi:MAG: metal ABC transporter permease [Lachnospiraceae bacterium]|nr:metal ABC transporter permease [Lachnospiraceae bacterium]